jgi:hypothetical protein
MVKDGLMIDYYLLVQSSTKSEVEQSMSIKPWHSMVCCQVSTQMSLLILEHTVVGASSLLLSQGISA